MKLDVSLALSLEANPEHFLFVIDLDDTLVYTSSYLRELGILKESSTENEIIRAYIESGGDIANAPVNYKLLHIVEQLRNNGVDVVILTARVSVPAQITLSQIASIFKGKAPDTYISLDKGTVVTTIAEVKNKENIIVIDDSWRSYASVKNDLKVVYYTPGEVI